MENFLAYSYRVNCPSQQQSKRTHDNNNERYAQNLNVWKLVWNQGLFRCNEAISLESTGQWDGWSLIQYGWVLIRWCEDTGREHDDETDITESRVAAASQRKTRINSNSQGQEKEEELSPTGFRGSMVLPMLSEAQISDVWPPDFWDNAFLLF